MLSYFSKSGKVIHLCRIRAFILGLSSGLYTVISSGKVLFPVF